MSAWAGVRAAVPEGALVHTRHRTLASQAIEYGTDVVELRAILGHASLATTRRYPPSVLRLKLVQ